MATQQQHTSRDETIEEHRITSIEIDTEIDLETPRITPCIEDSNNLEPVRKRETRS